MATNPPLVTPPAPLPDYLSDSCAQIAVFEGVVPHMYLDQDANVTCGIGLMLPSLTRALQLPWMMDGMAATPEQITASWYAVVALKPGMAATSYSNPTQVYLTLADIEGLLRGYVAGLDKRLPNLYATYPLWPEPAKLAILDCAYNLGLAKLASEYPHMNSCLRMLPPNFAAASIECERNSKNAGFTSRNAWTAHQFTLASVAPREGASTFLTPTEGSS